MSSRLPNRNQGLVTTAACFYLQPFFVRVTRRAFGPSLIGDGQAGILNITTPNGCASICICMDIRMMHQLLSARDGRYVGGITGRPAEKVTAICLETHHCLPRQWGLMAVQQRAALRPDPSQSTSMGTAADFQLSSPFAESMKRLVRGFLLCFVLISI